MSLLLIILATWRLTSMLVEEHGPFAIFARLRQLKFLSNGGRPDADKKVLDCIYCASVWAAAGVIVLWAYAPLLVWVLAISASTCLVTEVKELIESVASQYYCADGEGW
jgi:hypothetical protein